MRRNNVISLFIMFAAVSVFVVVMAIAGRSPKPRIAAPTATNFVIDASTPTPGASTAPAAATETPLPPTELPPTEAPTEEPTPTPVVRPVINEEDYYDYSTKSVDWALSSKLADENDPESRTYTVDAAVLKAVDGFGYLYRVGDGPEKTVYLTYNLGYEDKRKSTLEILDKLKANNIRATFFMSLNYIQENPDIVRAIYEGGHVLGTRGDIFAKGSTGTGMTYLSTYKFSDTLWSIEELFQNIAGDTARTLLYRPDKFSPRDLAVAEAMGYTVVFRSFDYYDWDESVDRNKALQSLKDNTCSGAIYQLSSSKVNAEVLDDYVAWAKDRGYSFAALDGIGG